MRKISKNISPAQTSPALPIDPVQAWTGKVSAASRSARPLAEQLLSKSDYWLETSSVIWPTTVFTAIGDRWTSRRGCST